MTSRLNLDRIITHLILILVTASIIFPIFFIINTSLKSVDEFLKYPAVLVKEPRWDNYVKAWQQAEMGIYFKNSVIITFFTALFICLFSSIAAFPISRNHFKGSNFIYLVFLSSTFLPTSLVPMVFIMKYLGFMNTYHGFILRNVGASIALPIFILVGYIKSIPKELDEAGVIDGCGYIRYIITVIIPLLKPAIATVFILTAIGAWNDFINPFLFLTDKDMRPLTSGLYMFVGQFSTDWTILCAGVIIIALPLIITYVFLQKYIISGMTSGAIKG